MTSPNLPVPLATPTTDDQRVDEPALRRLVEHVVAGGGDALFVMATTGEFVSLVDAERVRAVEVVVDAAAGRVPVWAGVGDTATGRTLHNIDAIAGLDVDTLVLCAPFYLAQLTQAELERHVHAAAERTPRPILLYNIPQTTHFTIAPDTVARLADAEAICGVKDSSGDFVAFQKLVEIGRRQPGFVVYQGQEQLAAASLLMGGHGLMSGLGNLVPATLSELHAACADGDVMRARALQHQLTLLSEAISRDFWLRGIKTALELLGLGSSRPLEPWSSDLGAEERDRIAAALAQAGGPAPALRES